jgi:hypothetical protein
VFAQSEVKFNFSPIFLAAKGFGATLDFPMTDSNDLRIGIVVVNLKSVRFLGAGLGLVHYFDSYDDERYFYINSGAAVGNLNIGVDDNVLISGTLLEVHSIFGRQIQKENGISLSYGIGLGYGQFKENHSGALSTGELFFGVQPRLEFQIGFSSNGRTYTPPRKWH